MQTTSALIPQACCDAQNELIFVKCLEQSLTYKKGHVNVCSLRA